MLFLQIIALGLIAFNSFAQTWTQTAAPSDDWSAVASSANGTKLVAVVGGSGNIYTSTNSGVSWMQTSAPASDWFSVVSSADGTKLVAGTFDGQIYTSADSGMTWTSNGVIDVDSDNVGYRFQLASSADGTILSAATAGGHIFVSDDSGTTWQIVNAPTAVYFWTGIASSADGTKLAATWSLNSSGGIYTSTNSGSTWISNNVPNINWDAIASSPDGTKLIAAPDGGKIYTSTNSGLSWNANNVPSYFDWNTVDLSADGKELVAGSFNGEPSYISTNSGTTWSSSNIGATSVATSTDGGDFFAIAGDGIYAWQTMLSPSLNIAPANGNLKLSWIVPSTNFVLQSSADLSSWTDLTNQPILNLTNLQDEVVLPMSNSNGFFRLKTP